MTKFELQQRTKTFHINVLKLCNKLLKTIAGYEIARQLIRSSGSVGSDYRAACRARSKADFIYKSQIVLEEADESLYWLEVIRNSELLSGSDLDALIGEADELVRIFNASDMTAKSVPTKRFG